MSEIIPTNPFEQFQETNLIILRGWPGSGKSTFAKKAFPDRRHYEADMFFIGQNGKYKFDARKLGNAHHFCQESVATALMNGEKVVVSNTFIRLSEMRFYLDLCRAHNYTFKIIELKGDFQSVHDVPEDKVKSMKENFESLSDDLKPFKVDIDVPIDPSLVKTTLKPSQIYGLELDELNEACVIVDMDGTLALFDKKDRSPYEDWKLEKDEVNVSLGLILIGLNKVFPRLKIFICSGRDAGRSLEPTRKWLTENEIEFDAIFMRKAGDQRADDLVKEEIYNENIKGLFTVLAVFDDRLSVCKLWWRLGLPLFRVGDPEANF